MGNLEKILDNIRHIWNQRTFTQKFALVFLTVAFVAVLTYFLAIGSQPEWDVLYNDLATPDASAVAEHMKEAGVPYKLTNGGKTILAPKDTIDQTRLDVAENDLIKQDDVGLEEVGKMPLGLTENQQQLFRQRMIQGELSRTIKKIKGVKDVRITIAEPERSVFSTEDDHPTASVMLILSPGIKISQEQVKAVKNLVAHSVPRLESEYVFVSDQHGEALSEDMSSGNTSTIDDLRAKYEKSIEKKVKNVLERIVGSDNVTVSVTAEMNFDRSESKIERFIPTTENNGVASGVLVSEQTAGEKYAGQTGDAPQGTPGTDSNVTNPTYVASAAGGNKSSNYNKDNIVKNYEVSKEIKNITYAPGEVERMTVAVALNKILTSKEQETIDTLVRTAAGIDNERGDIVTVTGMAFSELENLQQKQEELAKQAQMDQYLSIFEKIAPYLLVGIFGSIAVIIFWSLVKQPVETSQYVEDEEDDYNYPEAPDLLEAASIPAIEAKLDPEIERMRSEINAFIMSDPAEAARLLLTYMKD